MMGSSSSSKYWSAAMVVSSSTRDDSCSREYSASCTRGASSTPSASAFAARRATASSIDSLDGGSTAAVAEPVVAADMTSSVAANAKVPNNCTVGRRRRCRRCPIAADTGASAVHVVTPGCVRRPGWVADVGAQDAPVK